MDTSVVPISLSDHDGVSVTVNTTPIKRGPGYYKLNSSLLEERTFLAVINETVTQTKQQLQEYLDPQLLWDMCKLKITEKAEQYSKRRAQNKKQKQNRTTEKLAEIHAL